VFDAVVRLAAVLLALLFAWAAAAKIIRFSAWRSALHGYKLPRPVQVLAVVGVPLLEAGVVALVLVDELLPAGALSLAAISAFSLVILRRRAVEGDRLPCGCFGRTTTRDYRALLARNFLIAILAAAILLGGEGVSLFDGLGAPGPGDVLPITLALAGISLTLWMVLKVAGMYQERGGAR
jgi:hypothetical protein